MNTAKSMNKSVNKSKSYLEQTLQARGVEGSRSKPGLHTKFMAPYPPTISVANVAFEMGPNVNSGQVKGKYMGGSGHFQGQLSGSSTDPCDTKAMPYGSEAVALQPTHCFCADE